MDTLVCMGVWCYLHSFCVFGAFSRTMLALTSLLLSCHTSVCLGALLNATHTPHNAGPRAMSRNTKQAMLDGIDRKRKRGYKGKPASYTCDGGGGGGGGGGDRRMSRSKEPVGGPVGPEMAPACPVWGPVGPVSGPAVRFAAGWPGSAPDGPVWGPVDRVRNRVRRFGAFSLLFFPKPKPNRPKRRETMELEAKSWGNSRSSTTTPDPRTKTTQNSTKSQIGQKAL